MRKTVLVLVTALLAARVFATVDVNQATEADLDGVKGIGPALSGKILTERQRSAFHDWNDLIARVKGMGPASAAKLSREGLTVNDQAFDDQPRSSMMKKGAAPAP